MQVTPFTCLYPYSTDKVTYDLFPLDLDTRLDADFKIRLITVSIFLPTIEKNVNITITCIKLICVCSVYISKMIEIYATISTNQKALTK